MYDSNGSSSSSNTYIKCSSIAKSGCLTNCTSTNEEVAVVLVRAVAIH